MSDLNKEQIKILSDYFGLTEEEVIENSDLLKDTLFYRFQEFKDTAIRVWNQLWSELTNYKKYSKKHNQKYYRKKKSQRKSWSKWKKRK